jgi:hypothetical protein
MDATKEARMANTSRISQFLAAIRGGFVSDVPPEYQACESCREHNCNSERAAHCLDRLCGEEQERSRRFTGPAQSGTLPRQVPPAREIDVASSRLSPPPQTVRVRTGGSYSQTGGEEEVVTLRSWKQKSG